MNALLYTLTALIYMAMTWSASRAYYRHADKSSAFSECIQSIGMPLVIVLHGTLLHQTIFRSQSMYFDFYYAISAMLWLCSTIYWIESFFFKLTSLRVLMMPIAGIACLLPLMSKETPLLFFAANPIFKLHFVIAIMAYGLLGLAVFHALLMFFLEKYLHPVSQHSLGQSLRSPGLSRFLEGLPPLLTLEKLLFRLIVVGFILLTLTLLSGIFFSETVFISTRWLDHKIIFSLLSWMMFATLLLGRLIYGWRGITVLRGVFAAFFILILAYIGSRFY